METAKVFGLGLLSVIPLALSYFAMNVDNQVVMLGGLAASTLLLGGFYTYDVWKNQTYSQKYKVLWTVFLLVLFAPMGIWVYWFQHFYKDWKAGASYSID
jgi:hypothetical protein